MKAIVCKAFAPVDQLTLEDMPSRPLRPGEVRMRVRAAGVNFPDSLKVEGQHQIKPELPWVPGSETGGVVEEIGSGVAGLAVGDRVMGVSE
ncbi:MAG: alcohol dehydrogenase catalytic domain-containing protein, partial [Pseudomonadota bacterium]|nr:alcohol dehydrogenase catalytic domain-containing protein [Pseudomonadota bacterium]